MRWINILRLTLLLIFSVPLFVQAQKTVDGFYVDLNNDSIPATFKLPKRIPTYLADQFDGRTDFSLLKEEIEVVDKAGGTQRLTPRDIKGFGFTYNSNNYKMLAKPVSPYQKKFLTPEVTGKKLKMYQYTIVHPGTAYHWDGFPAKGGSSPWKEYYWTFEKHDRTYLFLNSNMRKKELVRMLKKFFKDDPQMHELVESKFKGFILSGRHELIKSIAEAYNEG